MTNIKVNGYTSNNCYHRQNVYLDLELPEGRVKQTAKSCDLGGMVNEKRKCSGIENKVAECTSTYANKGNNKITELRTILRRESQNS